MNKTAKMINQIQTNIYKHFNHMVKKIDLNQHKTQDEAKVFLDFFDNFQRITSQFYASVQKLVEDFKQIKKQQISDPKLKLLFDLILSKIIQYNTEKKVTLEEVDSKVLRINRRYKEFQSMSDLICDSTKNNLQNIKQALEKFQFSYEQYISEFKKNTKSSLKDQKNMIKF